MLLHWHSLFFKYLKIGLEIYLIPLIFTAFWEFKYSDGKIPYPTDIYYFLRI